MLERPNLILPSSARRLVATSTGLVVPGGDGSEQRAADHPAIQYVNTFLTYEEMGGERMDEAKITERLAAMSAYDCLQALGRLSCMVHSGPLLSIDKQLFIMKRLGWNDEVRGTIEGVLRDESEGRRAMFFPQQIVHLVRLVVRYGDDRPPDDFRNGELVESFIGCLLGVTDLLEESDLDEHRVESVVPWIVRQWAINGRSDSMLLWTRYYDVLVRT